MRDLALELRRMLRERCPAKSGRVMEALLQLKKLEIEKLKRAHAG